MTGEEFQQIVDQLIAEFQRERAEVTTVAELKSLRARWLGKKGVVRYLEYRLVGREWPHPIPGAPQ